MLSIALGAGSDALNLRMLRQAIFDALNNDAITVDSVFIESTSEQATVAGRRAIGTTISVSYVIRVPAEDASSVESSVTNADLMTSLTDAGLVVDSVVNTNMGALEATTSAPVTAAVVYNYIIVTVVADLPAGAYMTNEQQDALLAAYLEAFSFPLDTPVEVSVDSEGVVTIECTVDHEPTESELTPKVLPLSYTNQDGNVVDDFSTTEASSANNGASTSSSSALSTGAVIGIAVGACALAVLVVVVVLMIRSKHNRVTPSPK